MRTVGPLAAVLALALAGCQLLLAENPDFESGGDASEPEAPEPPAGLYVETLGDDDDADVDPLGPALLLAGGEQLESSLAWLDDYVDDGDVLVLQSSGPATLGELLHEALDDDSVQTVIVPSEVGGDVAAWIGDAIDHAEVVLIVGDDPRWLYWSAPQLRNSLASAWQRGVVIGGVDAGVSLLGEFAFTGVAGPLGSAQALSDPYTAALTLVRDYMSYPPLAHVVLEPRFAEHDRMGRLLSFAARVIEDGWAPTVIGVGIDEDAALAIGPDGVGEVLGPGLVYLVHVNQPAGTCEAGLPLELASVPVTRLSAGEITSWPGGASEQSSYDVSVIGGVTMPPSPY